LIHPSHGGSVQIDEKGFIVGSPELVAEIAGSSVHYDLVTKHEVYRRNGVREYLIHRVYDGAIDWFALRDGQYEPLPVDADGIIRSLAFPGLWLKAASLVDQDMPEVLRVLQLGLASVEHAEFISRLAAAGRP
jgi:Uma2 family endonuclease